MALAYVTVVGFILRGIWVMLDSPIRQQKWVKIAPHVIDTLLLAAGVAMAISLSMSPFSGWLAAKFVGLLSYIGFGVLTMRATNIRLKILGFVGALVSVAYIFAVAMSRQVWPF
ncbi:MAG: SirB2 family protein [Gammaproteobacteria bacterium]|nr:SirB2 family protein [Gammaproteobacteria bacterium]MCZ6854778.1 SirB2 family protein [Gammaproteobacteria bacterium]